MRLNCLAFTALLVPAALGQGTPAAPARPRQASSKPQSPSYDALIAKALSLLAGKNAKESVAVSEQAIALDEKRWEAYATAASAYSAQQLYDDTISMLQMALGRAPEEKKQAVRQAITAARSQLAAEAAPKSAESTGVRPEPVPAQAAAAFAQDVPPPPRLQDNGPSLEVTTRYITETLNGLHVASLITTGQLTFIALATVSSAKADPNDCRLSWHATDATESAPDVMPIAPRRIESDWQLSLRDAQQVLVETESDFRRYHAIIPRPETQIRPDHYHLSIKMQKEKRATERVAVPPEQRGQVNGREGIDWAMEVAEVELPDEDSANRLAKAIVHAIELCGGGDNDPFK